MRILLDECVDRRLAGAIAGHAVTTVPQMGWAGISNGDLLRLAVAHADVLITTDTKLPYQHPIDRFNIALIVLHAPSNRLDALLPLVPQLLAALPRCQAGSVTVISPTSE